MGRLAAVAPLVLVAGAASAHVGAVVAKANFVHPLALVTSTPDGGGATTWSYAPEIADQSYHIDWTDGDVDPTGKFTFYYLDHGVSDAVSADDVESLGTLVKDTLGRDAATIWVSCMCIMDAGVQCPDAGVRRCDNFVDWDTSAVPDGAYWIAAVNNDPPFHVYNLSPAPVIVSHAGKPPPAVVVVRPDGLGSASRTYDIQVVAVGTGAMKMDLSWGPNTLMDVLGPTHAIAKAVPVAPGADGTTHYLWDVSALPNGNYFVRASVTDDNGQSYSDSRFAEAVFHPAGDDGGAPPDLAAAAADGDVLKLPPPSGCSCNLNAQANALAHVNALALALVIALALRRRRR